MITKKQIGLLFEKLNSALSNLGEFGEIGIVGGAVMCLVYNARESTRDVDAIFEPKSILSRVAKQIAKEEGLSEDWLNDAVKGFLQPGFVRQEVLSLSNLRVWAPEPRYMLAMKCISARWDTNDRDDVIFLIKFLKLKTAESVYQILEGYYTKDKISSKTQFFVEEIFEEGLAK
jgi:hypothetical protein